MDGLGVEGPTGHSMEPNVLMGAEKVKSNETKESSCSEVCVHCQIRGEKDPKGVRVGRVDNGVETYAGQVSVSAAGMRSGEGSKAGMSAMTTSTSTKSSKASNTTGTTFKTAAKSVV